ncbi:MAG TPA: hypothetical protein VHO66_01245, partial [Ruminiclostridium sp.]|nr:hypothetical protein [Ruminiclostridium sp.]
RIINKNENQVNINSFIAEIIELLRIVQPITPSDLLQLYREVKDFRNFSFAKRDASKFHREIKYRYILKLLMNVNIIKAHDSYITLTDFSKAQNLMFRYYGKAESEERNRMLCRKYRYGDVI